VTAASIWVDADACPNVIKEILYGRRAYRVSVTLVANQPLQIPRIRACAPFRYPPASTCRWEIVKRAAPGTSSLPLIFLSRRSDRQGRRGSQSAR